MMKRFAGGPFPSKKSGIPSALQHRARARLVVQGATHREQGDQPDQFAHAT